MILHLEESTNPAYCWLVRKQPFPTMSLFRVHSMVAIFSWLCALAPVVVTAVRDLQIVTPLQALTIPDGGGFNATELTRRQAFLERFQAGIEAEMKVLDRKNNNYGASTAAGSSGLDFLMEEDKEAERAFTTATKAVASRQETRRKLKQNGDDGRQQQYQFVGVIQPVVESSSSSSTGAGGGGGGGPAIISWYARPKPKDARWSMRLVHVNREAVIKHLFDQGKVDIYGKYQTVTDAATGERMVEAKYTVTPRSWR
jgi:hypothetical protein